jgi:malonyl-CoA O-methyltransferase
MTIGRKLVDMLGDYPNLSYGRVLEIGCCTGVMTEMFLASRKVEKLYLNDLVSEFYPLVSKRLKGMFDGIIEPLFGDIEDIDLPGDLDLVISSSTFQWLSDLSNSLAKITSSLKQNGFLAFSLFGPGTLTEFRQLTGVGLSYAVLGRVLELLEKEFVLQFVDTETYKLYFTSPREVLKHLQATGVGGVGEFRWTSRKLREFEASYVKRFGTQAGVPLTYVSSYVIGTKK